MTLRTPLSLALALAAMAPTDAAECDCSRRVGLCQAEARYDGERIFFTSQTDQCSRISFSLDHHAASITIQKGQGSALFPLTEPAADRWVSVDACFVCDVHAPRR